MLALLCTAMVFCTTAGAEKNGLCGDAVTWNLDDDYVMTISGTGAMYEYSLDKNRTPWYTYRRWISRVIIEDGVTSIGNWAFNDCVSMTSVSIGNSVTRIGERAFGYCCSMVSVTIPESVTTICDDAFYRCEKLTDLTIGNHVASIGDGAFRYCYSLLSVTIPDSVTEMGNLVFTDCDQLTTARIGNSVSYIGVSAFLRCESLTSCVIGNSVTSIQQHAFDCCENLISITIPDSVISIDDYAFSQCVNLKEVKIGNSVASIGGSAFWRCTSLTNITIPDSVTSMPGASGGCSSLISVTFGTGLTEINGFSGCSSLISVTIGYNVTSIGNWAFSNCSNLTSVTILNPACTIAADYWDSFEGHSSSMVIYGWSGSTAEAYALASGVTFSSLGDPESAFMLPASLQALEDEAFSGIGAIAVVIPKGVITVTGDPFSDSSVRIIYGYADSEAEILANAYGYTFVEIDDAWLADH